MESGRFLEFVANHWVLWLALVVILALLVGGEIRRRLHGVRQVTPTEAIRLINHEDALVLDVRTPEELKGSGMIAGARHIPLEQFKNRVDALGDHKRPVVVYCRSGNRSNRAAALLRKQGFESVHNLAGGILAWQNANLPLTSATRKGKSG